MSSTPPDDATRDRAPGRTTARARPTLRERKKTRTRFAIQQEALRLFREQGYSATTVEQIADAAEVSPSTFFRYFPTKDTVVLTDDYDPVIIERFRAQPPGLTVVPAFRAAFRETFANVPQDQLQAAEERNALIVSVPELRAAFIEFLLRGVQQIAELVAERTGRPRDDSEVVAATGAVLGVIMSSYLLTGRSLLQRLETIDAQLAHLETGFTL
jgi:AcrR family transcriptional regulator